MENKEIIVRKIANRVSKRYNLYPPVNFKNVFEEKGIKYIEERLATDGDGYSELKDSNLEVVVNSEMDYMPRKRFTIAHELGHIFIPASNEPSGCLQTFGDCREGQIPRSLLRYKFDAPSACCGVFD